MEIWEKNLNRLKNDKRYDYLLDILLRHFAMYEPKSLQYSILEILQEVEEVIKKEVEKELEEVYEDIDKLTEGYTLGLVMQLKDSLNERISNLSKGKNEKK